MECSELAWVIKMMEISAACKQEYNRFVVPGIPIIPVPSRLTNATSSILVIPLTACFLFLAAEISVPNEFGLKVFLIKMGIFFLINGDIIFG